MKIRGSDIFFYIAFVLIVFLDFLTKTQFISTYPLVNAMIVPGFVLTTVLLIITISFELRMSIGRFIYIGIMLLFTAILARASGNYQKIVTLGLLLLAVKDRNLITILKLHLYMVSILVMTIISCYLMGFLPGGYSIRDSTIRYFFGFSYTSYLSNFLFHIILTAIFVYKEKLSLIFCILFLAINHYVYLLTDTKSAYYLTFLILIVYFLFRIFSVKRNLTGQMAIIFKVIEQFSFPVATIFVIILTRLYNLGNPIVLRLDQLLTYRLMLGARAMEVYPVNLLGNKIVWAGFNTGMQYLYVDSSFLNILLNYGIVTVGLFSIGYFILGKKNIYRDSYYMLSFVFLIMHSLFDPQYIEIAYNPFTLFLSMALLTNSEISRIKLKED